MQRRPGFPARLPQAGRPAAQPPPAAARAPSAAAPASALRPQGAGAAQPPAGLGLDSAAVRARMVQRLADCGIAADAVLQAMLAVERHRFVDGALVTRAYEDSALPIGLGQTISQPRVVARMCELLLGAEGARAGAGLGRVLEIGTGCGYQAAVLSHLAREVYTIERLRALHDKARANLRPLRLANVHLLFGDGMAGYASGAPYAAIIAAAGGAAVPPAWGEQLAVGGRLVAPVARPGAARAPHMLLVLDKTRNGLQQSWFDAVHFVPLKSGIA